MTEQRKGELLVLCAAVLWSLFPVVTILSLRSLASTDALAYSTLFALILLDAGFTVLFHAFHL